MALLPSLTTTGSIAVVLVALLVGWGTVHRKGSTKKWHEGPEWQRLFRIYDEIAEEQYGTNKNCESRLVPSRIRASNDEANGDGGPSSPRYETQVHICGDPESPPAFFFHGAATNSLMWGDWLVPTLSKSHRTVAVDFPCDLGRSYVRDGDVANCPQNASELTDWARDLMDQLTEVVDDEEDGGDGQRLQQQKASLVGYSYGSFVASQIATKYPESVNRLVLFAPAAVFAPLSKMFLLRAVTFGTLYGLLPTQGSKDWIRDWFFGWMMADDAELNWTGNGKELRVACDEAGPAVLPVAPAVLDSRSLESMNAATPTMLVIGEDEVVIDAGASVKAAEAAGIRVKKYPKSGHMLVAEYPREEVVSIVSSFLNE